MTNELKNINLINGAGTGEKTIGRPCARLARFISRAA